MSCAGLAQWSGAACDIKVFLFANVSSEMRHGQHTGAHNTQQFTRRTSSRKQRTYKHVQTENTSKVKEIVEAYLEHEDAESSSELCKQDRVLVLADQ